LFAARGEYEPFQVAVRALKDGLTGVRLSVDDLAGPKGKIIPASNISLYREHYVEVKTSSPNYNEKMSVMPGQPGWYPDALIPFIDPATGRPPEKAEFVPVPVDVPAGENQPFWVDVFVPRDAVPGRYKGKYTMMSDQGGTVGEIVLTVWDFELPLKPSCGSSFDLWHDNSREAIDVLIRHKVFPKVTPAECAREFMDKGGLTMSAVGFWSGADVKKGEMKPAPAVDEVKAVAAKYPAGIMLYNYTADEIVNYSQLYHAIKGWARNMHAAGVKQLITMAPVPELVDAGDGRPAVDIWVIQPKYYAASPENVAAALKRGEKVWTYTALVQDTHSPKWLIDFAPINYRIMQGFLNQSMGFTGILEWCVDYWTKDPWRDVSYRHEDGNNMPGEGMLVYPGKPAGCRGVVPSMRLKWIREGIEDYEYVELLKNKGRGDLALEVARTSARDFETWSPDPAVLMEARAKLGGMLEKKAD
jgi:hypothetical protein